ncbi:hypothetical protein N7488_000819 [Penicillium malachiteum]|nr:hypothetical protein N7488_000819 [Penicillium malachiteum]
MLRRDYAYLIFFIIHIPIIFLIDTAPLQPSWLRTELSQQLRDFYISTYRDKFFEEPAPVWFTTFIWMELLYHVPLSIWAIGGLLRDELLGICAHMFLISFLLTQYFVIDHPLVPVHLLIFGVQAFITSLTCLVDVWSWEDRSTDEKTQITYLYAPYVALGALMALDMIFRLRRQLQATSVKSKRA